jgi:hypothetical protein
MFRGYSGGLLLGRGDERASGQVVCLPEEAAGVDYLLDLTVF